MIPHSRSYARQSVGGSETGMCNAHAPASAPTVWRR
ncbi:hypothetical protein UC8_06970 [Roseimaritima ulvae]|uniref:Uncharacterized protein n=1 Tax=Roseimaritima ulvae TaxID=980254 RepID=A0A5B9QL53_9BACT|nr:hypothetical protein UC8_06970 [Roseimaritima ulvae]